MSRVEKTLLLGIVVVGLGLRLLGLSHDLAEQMVYHPDSAKQMRVVSFFLDGRYFVHVGDADWDGYPYLLPHLIEILCRLYRALAQFACRVLGIRTVVDFPREPSFFWIARALNVLFSTAAVVTVARIGVRSFGAGAGLLGALFLALSPIDVVGCHYEGADTAAAFFATLALLFALRVYDRGRALDYVGATFVATCAFATKYHAGMSILPLLVAHALRERSRAGLFSGHSLARVGLVVATGVVSLPLTMPGLWVDFGGQLRDIVGFFGHLSEATRAREPETVGLGKIGRVVHSSRRQLPVLAALLGPALSAVVVASPFLLRRGGQRLLILLSMPFVYLFVGIAFRPGAPPVYHTLITPIAFAIAGAALAARQPLAANARRAYAALVALAVVASTVGLARASLRQDFFFYHRDTRMLAQEWARENVPASFQLYSVGYGFELDRPPDPASSRLPGSLFVSSSLRPTTPGASASRLKVYALERQPTLPVFRNPTIVLSVEAPALRSADKLPPLPRIPSADGNELVVLGGAELYRSETLYDVAEGETVRTLVSNEPLDDPLVLIRNGAEPAKLVVSFGEQERRLRLRPEETAWFALDRPAASFPSGGGRFFYRFRAKSGGKPVRVAIATTEAEKAVGLYGVGAYAEAAPRLARTAEVTADPAVAAMAIVARRLAGGGGEPPASLERLAAELADDPSRARLDEIYGGVLSYLEALPYLGFQAEGAGLAGFDPVDDLLASGGRAALARDGGDDGDRRIFGFVRMLGPGNFTVSMRVRTADSAFDAAEAHLVLTDAAGRTRDEPVRLSGLRESAYVERRFTVPLPYFSPQWTVSLRLDRDFPLVVDRIDLAPDLVANVRSLARALRFAQGGGDPAVRVRSLADDPLLIAPEGARRERADLRAELLAAAAIRPLTASDEEIAGAR